jgi:hypothetical protein
LCLAIKKAAGKKDKAQIIFHLLFYFMLAGIWFRYGSFHLFK